jgi:hypothetical protein
VGLDVSAAHDYVVQVDEDERHTAGNAVHHALESIPSVAQPKTHTQQFYNLPDFYYYRDTEIPDECQESDPCHIINSEVSNLCCCQLTSLTPPPPQ